MFKSKCGTGEFQNFIRVETTKCDKNQFFAQHSTQFKLQLVFARHDPLENLTAFHKLESLYLLGPKEEHHLQMTLAAYGNQIKTLSICAAAFLLDLGDIIEQCPNLVTLEITSSFLSCSSEIDFDIGQVRLPVLQNIDFDIINKYLIKMWWVFFCF